MSAVSHRAPLFVFILSLCVALISGRAHAQIHEEKPAPGLQEGVLVHWDKQADQSKQLPAGKTIGTGDFSVVCSIAFPVEIPALNASTAILTGSDEVASHDAKAEWKLLLNPDRSLSFTARPREAGASVNITTPPNVVRPAHAHDIVVSVHRDARQPYSGIWVDGIELASGMFTPIDLRASLPGGDWDMSGWVKSVTVYDRALTRPEVVELTLPRQGEAAPARQPAHSTPSATGPRFVPHEDETIALIGGTEAVALAESGQLEAMLLMAFPQTRFHFRNLAWEGDTVFRQDRPMNFGSLEQQLRRINASSALVMFGRQECLDAAQGAGAASPGHSNWERLAVPSPNGSSAAPGLPEFKEAFEKLLSTVEKVTPSIVVIAPPPYDQKPPPLPDFGRANQEIVACRQAMREVADKHRAVFVETSLSHDIHDPPATSDGVQFNPDGLRMLTDDVAASLKLPGFAVTPIDGRRLPKPDEIAWGLEAPKRREQLCAELGPKNRLWHDYWRPSNWAFLYGDRTNQPSSRDPVNSQIRFFPSEQEKYLPLIKEAEEKVYRTVEETTKKLP